MEDWTRHGVRVMSAEIGMCAGLAGYAVAGAAFDIAEVRYEDFLKVKFPEGLDFQQPGQYDTKRQAETKKKKAEESVKKFTAYLDSKAKLLNAKSSPDSGVFARVHTVQRLDTRGGTAPAQGCDSTTVSQVVRVPYTAKYLFYAEPAAPKSTY